MGDQNNPEIARSAGLEPLNSASQSEADDEAMQINNERSPGKEFHSLMQTARDGLVAVDGKDGVAEDSNISLKADGTRRVRPTIQVPLSKDSGLSDDANLKGESVSSLQRAPSDPKAPIVSPVGPNNSRTGQYEANPPASSRRHSPSGRTGSFQTTRSPDLRKYAIPASEGSPKETLPAMQDPSSSLSSKSPNSQQSLPPLRAINLEPLSDDIRANNLNHRQSFPLPNGIHSPPMSSIASKMSPYPSRLTPLNGHFQPSFSSIPSPISTFSESPREPYRPVSDPTSMSPPGKFNQPQNPNGRTSQSEESAPLSAESFTSTGTFSNGASPNGDQTKIDGNPRMLPPLGSGPLLTGIFKCDHPGCTAPPFQTQYLLNSHANVHSQIRPHYCPVKDCNRSEGGKGFKRKNEMIRHGLVHASPGYICPFCPEREHKYPRPDNLQRHVRVNHTDRNMDDPQLREVLAQRSEGGSRGRRRRLGG